MMQSIAHDPETTPSDPALLKFQMGRSKEGYLLAICYIEYSGVPSHPGTVVGPLGPMTDDHVTKHILDCEVVRSVQEGEAWFERVREQQPWIKRN